MVMPELAYDEQYSESTAENYERYFVPVIGGPVARDLVEAAALGAGERVLDVGCGTGIVARLAAENLNGSGAVAGLDVNAGMLAVAREVTPRSAGVDWYEANAEAIPLPDGSFDVVLCQMSLQFIPGRVNALREMRRILAAGGRLVLNVPGPTPPLFEIFADALTKHINPEAAPFVHAVFSLNDANEIRKLADNAGLGEVRLTQAMKPLQLPPARDFMWQYINCTPMINAIAGATNEQRLALEREICERWQEFATGDGLEIEVGMTTLTALPD
jgi:ubiquinone/menaquinone biosynthesis C-methylase UbiE